MLTSGHYGSFLVNIPCMIDATARVFSNTFDSDYRTIIAAVGVIINQLATCGRLRGLFGSDWQRKQ